MVVRHDVGSAADTDQFTDLRRGITGDLHDLRNGGKLFSPAD
jgi:hypothetical protein